MPSGDGNANVGLQDGSPTAQQVVLDKLRTLILRRGLQPSERIYQDEIAKAFGVSRLPVREALKVLESEGLVTYTRHRGYTVRALSLDELEEIYLIRQLLETEAIRRAVPRISNREVEHLRNVNDAMGVAETEGDRHRFTELNREFHLALFELSRLPRLVSYITSLWRHSEMYRSIFYDDSSHRLRVQHEHSELIDACADRDTALAIVIMDDHRNAAIRALRPLLPGSEGDGQSSPRTAAEIKKLTP